MEKTNTVCLKIEEGSILPGSMPGDIAIVDPSIRCCDRCCDADSYFAVLVGGKVTIIRSQGESGADFSVIGKVVGLERIF